jgi:hypothetical protein
MIDEKEVELYQRITAPDSLRQRVLDIPAQPKKRLTARRQLLAAAACLVLILSSVLGMRFFSVSVSYEARTVGTSGVSVFPTADSARALDLPQAAECGSFQIPLTITAGTRTTICVSGGTLRLPSLDGTLSDFGMQTVILGNTTLYWNVPIDASSLMLTVSGPMRHTVYRLSSAENGWLLEKTT